jgi:hypothetical protein
MDEKRSGSLSCVSGIWVLTICSQIKEKCDKQTPVPPAAPKPVTSQYPSFREHITSAGGGILGAAVVCGMFIVPYLIMRWLELGQDPFVRKPKVLEELLEEVRLLRLAVEQLAGQQ